MTTNCMIKLNDKPRTDCEISPGFSLSGLFLFSSASTARYVIQITPRIPLYCQQICLATGLLRDKHFLLVYRGRGMTSCSVLRTTSCKEQIFLIPPMLADTPTEQLSPQQNIVHFFASIQLRMPEFQFRLRVPSLLAGL